MIEEDDEAISRSEEERERIAAVFDSMPIDSAEVALRYWDRPREQLARGGKGLNGQRQTVNIATAPEIVPLVQETTSPEFGGSLTGDLSTGSHKAPSGRIGHGRRSITGCPR